MPLQPRERFRRCYDFGRLAGGLEAAVEILNNDGLDPRAKTRSIATIVSRLTAGIDLPNAKSIQASISGLTEKLDADPAKSPWAEAEFKELAEMLSEIHSKCFRSYAEEVGDFKSERETSRRRRNEAARKMDVVRRVGALSKQTEQEFFHLAKVAKEVELNAAWTLELSDLSDEKLVRTIRECRAMGDEAFKKHLMEGGLKTLPRFLKMIAKDVVVDYKPKSKKAPDTKSGAAKAAKQP